MGSLRPIMHYLAWVMVISIALYTSPSVSAVDIDDFGQPAGTITIPKEITHVEIQDAIISALVHRQWNIKSRNENQIVGYIKQRKNEATVTFIYTSNKIDMYCVGWRINPDTGQRVKPEQPAMWLNFLRNEIIRVFDRLVTTK